MVIVVAIGVVGSVMIVSIMGVVVRVILRSDGRNKVVTGEMELMATNGITG